MVIEDSGSNVVGSNHNFLWCEVKSRNLEVTVKRIRLKWRVTGRQDWEEYHQTKEEAFVGWKKS